MRLTLNTLAAMALSLLATGVCQSASSGLANKKTPPSNNKAAAVASPPPSTHVIGGAVMKRQPSTLAVVGGAAAGKRTGEINGTSIRAKQH